MPRERVADIADAIEAIKSREVGWRERMAAGERTADFMRFRSLIYPGS
jgi:hypothetical protein